MRMQEFEYHSPTSVGDACRLLDLLPGAARVIAGGTDVLADMKQGSLAAGHLVSLSRIEELKEIEVREDGLYVGALVPPNELAASDDVRSKLPALSEAAASMGGYQIRNLATIGGNLVSAVPSADLPPSLLVTDAVLLISGAAGERRMPIADFFTGPRRTDLRADEILTGILVPPWPEGTGTAYLKFQLRDASALAVVGAAARLTLTDGTIESAAVAIGAAAPTPLLIGPAADALAGAEPTLAIFEEAGRIAATEVKPIDDLRGSADYRRDLARVLTVRALEMAHARATGEEVAR